MGKTRKNGISPSTLITGIALGMAVFSFVLTWYVIITRPKHVPKPYLAVTVNVRSGSPPRSTIIVQNVGEAVAHDILIYAKYPTGAKITFLDKGIFDLVEGGVDKVFARFEKDQVGPGVSLPYILLAGEKNGISVEPEIYGESREILEIPIHFMKESEGT